MAYPTLAQCKAFMGVAGAGDDIPIAQILAAVVEQVEQYCARVFVAGAATHTYPVSSPWVSRDLLTLYLFRDLVSVTTLTNGDGVVIAAANYDLRDDEPYHKIVLREGLGYRWASDGLSTPITVLGSWGYSAACPADIFLAIMELVGTSYRGLSDGSGTQLTAKGAIIDKSTWPKRILRVLDLKARK